MADLAARLPRDVVRVSGPDAVTFLQGQLSQDIEKLEAGARGRSLLLEPDGKLGYLLGVERTGDDTFDLDIDAGFGAGVAARLTRFKLRVHCDIDLIPAGPADDSIDLAHIESDRIAAGIPAMGAELTEGVIAEEAGVVADSVSFTKGCFVGQELVARIDSRGANVPRRLRHVVIAAVDELPPVGSEVVVGGDVVGTITSIATTADGGAVALAYIKRAVDPPAEAEVRWDGGAVRAQVKSIDPAPTMQE